jgi:hypothetical protein
MTDGRVFNNHSTIQSLRVCYPSMGSSTLIPTTLPLFKTECIQFFESLYRNRILTVRADLTFANRRKSQKSFLTIWKRWTI